LPDIIQKLRVRLERSAQPDLDREITGSASSRRP